ncbi:hypothetical protein BuS5_00575 [Desulfosarcina sp. BuS5]|uniref:hypothetical protein n=1 Tax=Desulfosarcina sp. BuS5 TaxID=933262 RepID=UPI00055496F5|nr:hypothetical protein [Desulfosarcina sp. BuS5]WDN87607.1 hypothetical protein BuS5_00575 [Desulfosarcina sp. BuS5]
MSVEKNINILIEYQCPQCGAPATLNETDRLIRCEYCRVKSYLMQKDYFRFMLPNKAPGDKELIFFPYWRFKGFFFAASTNGITHRLLDISYQAVKSTFFPVSAGLRTQTLKMRFVAPDTKGNFLKPQLSINEVMEIIDKRSPNNITGNCFHTAHIGESLSLIYAPFYLDKRLYDAVLNKPISNQVPDNFDIETLPGGSPAWSMRFVPTLCPHCGWDMEGDRGSLVLTCRNCNSIWQPGRKELKPLKFVHIPGQGDNITYFPFYRVKAEISGLDLSSYADLARIANIPKVIQKDWEEKEFFFWTLGFKVRPKIFLRIQRDLTLLQPQDNLQNSLPDSNIYPVTLPVKEAIEGLKIILGSFIKPRSKISELSKIKIKPKSFLLVYIPFDKQHHEYMQRKYKICINKNMLSHAGNL